MKGCNMNFKLLVVLLLLIGTVIFTAQNHGIVEISFLIWSFKTSRAIIIFSALFAGFILGWITSFVKRKKK